MAYEVTTNGLVGTPPATATLAAVQWAAAAGTANAITAAYSTPNVSLTDGLLLGVRALGANTSTTPTFAPDGLTPHTITKAGGSPLFLGDIPANLAEILLRYNLANTRWELLNPAQGSGELFKCLTTDDTGGQNINTAQPWFPSAGGVTVAAGTYVFDGHLFTTRAAGTTSHTTGLLFGGSAAVSAIGYEILANTGDANALTAEDEIFGTATSTVVAKAASTSATENSIFEVKGTVTFSGAGTFIPQFTYSVAPGGAPTIKVGTFFRLRPYTNPQGTWA